MADEEVTSPDQHKPDNLRLWRSGWVLTIALMLVMMLGNHRGKVEDIWLIAIAGVMTLGLVIDVTMRKKGLKRYE